MKICSKCGIKKDVKEFYKRKASKDGVRHICKECANKYGKNWHENNPEYKKEYHKKQYENNPEYHKTWNENNPIKAWAKDTIYNHKQRGFTVLISKDKILTMAGDTSFCPICGCDLIYRNKNKSINSSATLDRMNNETIMNDVNTWIICHLCNRKKRTKSLNEYLMN